LRPEELPTPTTPPEEIRETIREILARPEFRPPPKTLFERVSDWVFEQIAKLLGVFVSGGTGTVIAWVLFAIAAAAFIFFVYRSIRSTRRDPDRGVVIDRVRRRSAAEWRAEADEHERARRWRPALRCRYRALLADLAERGLVEEIAGRTTGEYRHDVSQAVPAVAPDFSRATDLFERAWYGDEPTGEDDGARFRELEGRVLAGASS
jgi:hypothetical protein